MKYLDKDQTLSETQHGFRKFCSCQTRLLETINNISSSINNHEQVDPILLDFSKAFDKVCHCKILLKLDYYGIKGNIHKSISNFLQNPPQLFVAQGTFSESVTVLSGVPQGTVLSPLLLLLLYINDMPNQLQCYSLMTHTFINQFPLVKMQTPYNKRPGILLHNCFMTSLTTQSRFAKTSFFSRRNSLFQLFISHISHLQNNQINR